MFVKVPQLGGVPSLIFKRPLYACLLAGSLHVACGGAEERAGGPPAGSGGAGAEAGTGGVGGASGGSAGSLAGGSGGNGGALDCVGIPMQASGSIAGESILTTGPTVGRSVLLGEQWANQHTLDAFDAWAWGTEFSPTPSGAGHFAGPGGLHYCVAEARWSKPYDATAARKGSITYSQISALGGCSDASGPTGTLNYCARDPNHIGTAPADCPVGALHLWGSVGARAIDETAEVLFGSGDTTAGLVDLTAVFGPGRVIQLADSPTSTEVRAETGFIRTQAGDDSVVFCVTDVVDSSQNSLTQLELQVVELGTCPGQAQADSVTGCL